MRVQSIENTSYLYTLLQVSVERFGVLYNQLEQPQKEEVEKIASRQCEIHDRILESSEAAKVFVPEERVVEEIDSIVSRFSSRDGFESELHQNGLDENGFEESVRKGLVVEAVMELIASEVQLCDESSASLYYYMNTNKFTQPEIREASHILITINPDFPENEKDQVINRCHSISERLKKKPARFSEQAQKYSECPTAMNGGYLGSIKRGVLFPTLDKYLFDMKVGQISEPLESPLGFHVLKCDGIQTEGVAPLEKVLPQIIEKINQRNQKIRQRNWIKSLFTTH